MVSLYFLFKELLHCFSKVATLFHIPPQTEGIPVSPYLHQRFLLCAFLITAILAYVKWYLTEGLICIPLINKDVEYLFMSQ